MSTTEPSRQTEGDPIDRKGLGKRFWERKPLKSLNTKEWEALCDGCGKCKKACPIDAIVETEDDDPEWAAINAELSPEWADNEPLTPDQIRPRDDPPRRPDVNEIVNP